MHEEKDCLRHQKWDESGEQYVELPRALCDIDGKSTTGQKSLATGFYQTRYKETPFIFNAFPDNWIPNSVIIDGMFLINTRPLGCHKTMADYGAFLLKRFVSPYLRKGTKEVHILFDDPGRQQDNPKKFEQARRDCDAQASDHLCMVFFDDAEVPTNWRQTVNCRKCKRGLTTFLSANMVDNVTLCGIQKFVTSGATGEQGGLEVTKKAVSGPRSSQYTILRAAWS